jgi:hypothetical protein
MGVVFLSSHPAQQMIGRPLLHHAFCAATSQSRIVPRFHRDLSNPIVAGKRCDAPNRQWSRAGNYSRAFGTLVIFLERNLPPSGGLAVRPPVVEEMVGVVAKRVMGRRGFVARLGLLVWVDVGGKDVCGGG